MKKKYAFVLEPSSHAELSASSAERWMTCPGSVALSRGLPNNSSAFAAQGTAAHYIAAEAQRAGGWFRGEYTLGAARLSFLGGTALVEGHEVSLDEELIEAVEEYLEDCKADAQPGDEVFVEQSFHAALVKLHPSLGGSADRVRWRPSTRQLRVTDYKHGAGVPVDVDDNRQLKYYALGALLTNPDFNAEEVELRIAQPRCDHEQGRFRSYKFPAFDLLDFAADIIQAAKRTEEFGADLVPSKKACKWCPALAANKCPAVEADHHALIQSDFGVSDPTNYSKEQIAEFLEKAPLMEARISAIKEFAYAAACRGEDIPGFKLVDKRATRKWADEAAVESALAQVEEAHTVKLKSPAQIEKLVGKKKFKELEPLVVKQSSGHALVPVSDPRPPAQVALLTDFAVESENAEAKEQ
jgi:hypothetical protein